MPTPCSACRRSSRSCIVDIPSGFCSECLARGSKCDLVARVRRLRKQLRSLEEKEFEMSRRELGSIEELEALERAAEGQRASSVAPSSSAIVSPSGWSSLDFSALEGLEFPGFGDETVQVSDRSSSSV
ncbi:hypothetical protein M501DRAFT_1003503 [Patellaria atrata CBS 101060]|uniref:Zn(2)-C6 fungal-type domain-containing protein n=1 Tax=Patellaria atrata CBS 101060 TaxID=1346257 RepID=A0A9P4SAI9_9PEZI|nr:hypothetical protein M501DRAFT_1003503 [Patellaria atrata CBS 101060]